MDAQEIQMPHNHQVVMNRFVAIYQADERVVAAFLGGSYARGAADAYSDLDLGLMVGAFPDMQAIEQDLFVDSDKVVTRRILRGTHQGEFMGIAPTGKEVSTGGVWLSHLRGGKIKEQWVYFDALGLLHQVGAKP